MILQEINTSLDKQKVRLSLMKKGKRIKRTRRVRKRRETWIKNSSGRNFILSKDNLTPKISTTKSSLMHQSPSLDSSLK